MTAVDPNPVPSLLERLFAESAEELTRFFTRRHGGEETARDLVQETFLAALRSAVDHRPEIASVRSAPAAYGRSGTVSNGQRREASGLAVNAKA